MTGLNDGKRDAEMKPKSSEYKSVISPQDSCPLADTYVKLMEIDIQ